jgi:hypothetical protein
MNPREFYLYGFQLASLSRFLQRWFRFDPHSKIRQHRWCPEQTPFGYEYAGRWEVFYLDQAGFEHYLQNTPEVNIGIFGDMDIWKNMSCEIFTSGPLPRLEFCFNQVQIRDAEEEELAQMYEYVRRMAEDLNIPCVIFAIASTAASDFRWNGKELEIDLNLLSKTGLFFSEGYLDRIWLHPDCPPPDNYPLQEVPGPAASYRQYQALSLPHPLKERLNKEKNTRGRRQILHPLSLCPLKIEDVPPRFRDFLFDALTPPYIFTKLPFDPSVGYPISIPQKNQFKFQGLSLIQAYLAETLTDDDFRDKFPDLAFEVPDLTLFEEDLHLFQAIELLNLIIDDPSEFRQAVQTVYTRYLRALKPSENKQLGDELN